MDIKLALEDKLKLLHSTYSDGSRLTHIKDEIYALVYSDNKMRLISAYGDIKIIDERYSLRYLGDDVIVLGSIDSRMVVKSILVNRKDFRILYTSDKYLSVCDNIIYVENGLPMGNTAHSCRDIFDLRGNKLISIQGGIDFSIQATDNEEYYIASCKKSDDFRETYTILKYDSKKNIIQEVWNDNNYVIDIIGYGLLMFSNRNNFKEVFVYDIINKVMQ